MKRLVMVLVFFGFAVSSFAEGVFDYGVDLRLRQEYFDNACGVDGISRMMSVFLQN